MANAVVCRHRWPPLATATAVVCRPTLSALPPWVSAPAITAAIAAAPRLPGATSGSTDSPVVASLAMGAGSFGGGSFGASNLAGGAEGFPIHGGGGPGTNPGSICAGGGGGGSGPAASSGPRPGGGASGVAATATSSLAATAAGAGPAPAPRSSSIAGAGPALCDIMAALAATAPGFFLCSKSNHLSVSCSM